MKRKPKIRAASKEARNQRPAASRSNQKQAARSLTFEPLNPEPLNLTPIYIRL
jgi:hypothetical protein